MQSTSRNYRIDTLRLCCAFLVIVIHSIYPWKEALGPLLKLAVPMFFMISGYFLYGAPSVSLPRMKRGIRKVGIVFLWSTALYFALRLYLLAPDWSGLAAPSVWWSFLLLNQSPASVHLWYLSAYLYALCILYFVIRYGSWRWAFAAMPFLFAGAAVVGIYMLQSDKANASSYTANFLFAALPYVLLGASVRRFATQEQLQALRAHRWGLVALLAALFLAEQALLQAFHAHGLWTTIEAENYLFCPLQAVVVFALVLAFPQRAPSWASHWGEQYSLYLYIFHMLFNRLLQRGGVNDLMLNALGSTYAHLQPVLVFGLTMLLVELLFRLRILSR